MNSNVNPPWPPYSLTSGSQRLTINELLDRWLLIWQNRIRERLRSQGLSWRTIRLSGARIRIVLAIELCLRHNALYP